MSGASRVSVRAAELADSERVLTIVRQSISQLCVADHHDDPVTLERWLANKTPEHFARWLADADSVLLVAELDAYARGVGNLSRAGKIHLCYVEPGFERAGLGTALLAELERRAQAWGLAEVSLDSTCKACGFYARHGYQPAAAACAAFGVLRCYPFKKSIGHNS